MILYLLGLVLFLGVHLVPTFPGLRADLRLRFGEMPYKGLFALLSVIGIVLIVIGFGEVRASSWNRELWSPPVWTKHIAFLLMLFSFVALVASQVPSRIRTALKHPMLVGVKLWALAHLIANGDLASLILFGSFLAWAVYDRISVKKRGALGPLGGARGGLKGDIIVVAVSLVLYVVMLKWGHAWLIGVRLIG
ncbi:MAG: NnrU family protein [Beijerinckiaceae bacterium]|jgi:uncharacterized membrane protein|nr:NnrU family protein [Beijerinckiaceae bacterium]MDO9440252.1 NnrU family protein [Beijerinckiaceae bacterium]